MKFEPPPRPRLSIPLLVALLVAKVAACAAVLATHFYGVHRDEFLYLSMGRHLRLFHMDFPPAIAILGNVARAIFGDSLATVRVLPTVEGAALIVITLLVVRELGGGRWAQAIAGVAMLFGPVFLRPGILFQPVVLDQIWWTLALLYLARVARGFFATTRRDTSVTAAWIGVGVALGLGLLTKFSIFFVGAGILGGVLLTPLRRTLATPWPWIAVVLTLVTGSPSLIGQITLGWPVVGQMHDLQVGQLEHVTYASFLSDQLMMVGPVSVLIAIVGLLSLAFSRALATFRVLAWACVIPFVIIMLAHGKAYYVGPVYPTLLAAGAVAIEGLPFAAHSAMTPLIRWTAIVGIVAYGVIALPISLPILAPVPMGEYGARLGIGAAVRTNQGVEERLPQDYEDMLGWEQQSRALAAVYRSLSPADQRDAVIGAGNYGEAGAAEFYRAKYDLPPVVSSVGSFWFFGPGSKPGRVLIMVGGDPHDIAPMYGSVVEAARVSSPWSVAQERSVPIYLARDQKMTLQQVWPRLAGQN